MKKVRTIEDKDRKEYLEQLRVFSQKINPKPNIGEIKKLQTQYIKARSKEPAEF